MADLEDPYTPVPNNKCFIKPDIKLIEQLLDKITTFAEVQNRNTSYNLKNNGTAMKSCLLSIIKFMSSSSKEKESVKVVLLAANKNILDVESNKFENIDELYNSQNEIKIFMAKVI